MWKAFVEDRLLNRLAQEAKDLVDHYIRDKVIGGYPPDVADFRELFKKILEEEQQ